MALLTQQELNHKIYNIVHVTITENNRKTYQRKFKAFLTEQKGFLDPEDIANLPLSLFYHYDKVTIISNNLATLAFKINDQIWLSQQLTSNEQIILTNYLL